MKRNFTLPGFCWLATAIVIFLLAVAGAVVLAQGSAPRRLTVLEKTLTGSTLAGPSLEQRLKKLEIAVFGKVQKGSLASRILALEKFAGVSESNYMPPLPPQFDRGEPALSTAPDRTGTAAGKAAADRKKPLAAELEAAVRFSSLPSMAELARPLLLSGPRSRIN
jgi:hypothetical protein